MFEPIRWITLHPALVHLPLGSFPVAALAYLVAARYRSERWSHAGDIALVFAALTATLAAGLGLLAYFLLDWPGGLAPWPVLHLVLGAATAVLSLALMGWRLRGRKRRPVVRWPGALATAGVMGLTFFTGWVGGEVLVYHAGVGVQAAGLGALAPPVSWPEAPPENLDDAMGRLRAAWGAASSRLSMMVVEKPSDAHYAGLAEDARHMQEVALWVIGGGGSPAEDTEARGQAGVGGGGTAGGGGHGEHERAALAGMAEVMRAQAQELEQAARQKDLMAASENFGALTGTCSACHMQHRWH